MSGRDADKFDRLRGRHKKRASKETRRWEQQHLPPRTRLASWVTPETEAALLELRKELDPWR